MLLGSKEGKNDEEKLRLLVEGYLCADEKLEESLDGALVVRSRVIVGCEFKVEIEELGRP